VTTDEIKEFVLWAKSHDALAVAIEGVKVEFRVPTEIELKERYMEKLHRTSEERIALMSEEDRGQQQAKDQELITFMSS
jgi:hypothetical protein